MVPEGVEDRHKTIISQMPNLTSQFNYIMHAYPSKASVKFNIDMTKLQVGLIHSSVRLTVKRYGTL
jgi:hypothetical protein